MNLSPRQEEILNLLMAGKANKDIADALGIGIGTVKQHVVALFKKLQVSNRAMAVSRGFTAGPREPPAEGSARTAFTDGGADVTMVLRPSSVLSLSLPDGAGQESCWRPLQAACTEATVGIAAVLVGRPAACGVDIFLGLQRVREDNSLVALGIARSVANALRPQGLVPAAGLASGYLMASLHRREGWTGEMVAGRTIALARSLRDRAKPGSILVDEASGRLMRFALRLDGPPAPGNQEFQLLGPDLPEIAAAEVAPQGQAVGRHAERRCLERCLWRLDQPVGSVVWLDGEAGMGKTTLARSLAPECRRRGLAWHEVSCRAGGAAVALSRLVGDLAVAATAVPMVVMPMVVLVDDLELADEVTAGLVADLALLARRAPVMLLCVARTIRQPAILAVDPDEKVTVGHLPVGDMAAMLRQGGHPGVTGARLEQILAKAGGVPLFAQDLLADPAPDGLATVPLTLVTLVLSRLDRLPLDRLLLSLVAQGGQPDFRRLAALWPEGEDSLRRELDRAVSLGVLKIVGQPGRRKNLIYDFHHPLIGDVLRLVHHDSRLEAMERLAGNF